MRIYTTYLIIIRECYQRNFADYITFGKLIICKIFTQYKNNILLYYKMSLNSNSSETSFSSKAPCAKLSFNINAFNGNKTNFNRCPSAKLHRYLKPYKTV